MKQTNKQTNTKKKQTQQTKTNGQAVIPKTKEQKNHILLSRCDVCVLRACMRGERY